MERTFEEWRLLVTNQVRFRPDREEIARELSAHYVDHVKDLERIGYDHDLARSRALEAMGDPEEVGRAMDRVHKPWLGWLWQVSRWLVWALCAVFLWSLLWNGWPEWGHSERWNEGEDRGTELACSASFRAGAYRYEVTEVQYFRDMDRDRSFMYIYLTATTPNFWLEGPVLGDSLEAVDSNGAVYTYHRYPRVGGSGPNSGHFKNRCWIDLEGLENSPEWVEITHKTAGWSFRIDLPEREATP